MGDDARDAAVGSRQLARESRKRGGSIRLARVRSCPAELGELDGYVPRAEPAERASEQSYLRENRFRGRRVGMQADRVGHVDQFRAITEHALDEVDLRENPGVLEGQATGDDPSLRVDRSDRATRGEVEIGEALRRIVL